jgi:hypothetical protein
VTATKSDNISWRETPVETVPYFGSYTLSFTVSEDYYPYILINDVNVPAPTPVDGVYTITLEDVRAAQKITVWAFAQNVLPVTGDTYVRGNTLTSFAGEDDLKIANSTYYEPSYRYRTYLQFDVPEAIKTAGYNAVNLQLVFKAKEKTGDHKLFLEVRPATFEGEIADLTWVNNNEPNGHLTSPTIAAQLLPYSDNSVHTIDISDILDSNTPLDQIKLQLSANENSQTTSDGFFAFYSLEGASKVNLDYLPALIFSKVTAIETPPEGSSNAFDAVVSVKYYTPQGIEVKSPVRGEIYIVKKVYKSSKTEAVKTLQVK